MKFLTRILLLFASGLFISSFIRLNDVYNSVPFPLEPNIVNFVQPIMDMLGAICISIIALVVEKSGD